MPIKKLKKQIKKNESERITITIPKLFLFKMRENAKNRGMSLSGYIRFAVSELEKGE